jgi:hypothetical protein
MLTPAWELWPGVMTETEAARIERDEQAGVGELGLRVDEAARSGASDLDRTSIAVVGEPCRSCVSCAVPLASKGRYSVTFRSFFGDAPARVRRLLAWT